MTAVERTGTGTKVATGPALRPRMVVVVSDRGVDLAAEFGEEYDPPVPLLRLPPDPADKVKFASTLRAATRREVKGVVVVYPEEDVETPAGKYRAVRSETEGTMDGHPFRRTHWYSKGVGLVREVYTYDNPDFTHFKGFVLKSFSPAQP